MRWLWFLVAFLAVAALVVGVVTLALPSPSPEANTEADGPEENMRQATQAMQVRDYPKAVALLTKCLDAMPDDPLKGAVYGTRARAFAFSEQHEPAIRDFTEAIRLCPDMPGFYRDRGESHLTQKEYPAALADLTESIRLDPDDPSTYYLRAKVFRALGKIDESLTDIRQAEKADAAEVERAKK